MAIPSRHQRRNRLRKTGQRDQKSEAKLDVLINNAGVTWSEDIDRFSEKAWDKIVDLDGKSPFFLTQKLLPCSMQQPSLKGDRYKCIISKRYPPKRLTQLLLCICESRATAIVHPNGSRP